MRGGSGAYPPHRPRGQGKPQNDSLLHGTQTASQAVRQDRRNRGNAQSYRSPENVLRPVSSGGETGRRAYRRGPAGGLLVGVSHQGFFREFAARIRRLPFRGAEV